MSNKTLQLNDDLYKYVLSMSLREHPVLEELRRSMVGHPKKNMQISPEQGQFLAFLVHILNAKKAIEIGVFTGYSSIAITQALRHDGKLIACDISDEYTKTAEKYWKKAHLMDKIDLRIAPALDTLNQLKENGEKSSFDFIFIDADKVNYLHYYEASLELLRPGGIIAIDNVLWSGKVIDPKVNDEETQAIRLFNIKLKKDDRVCLTMLPLADGLTLALKK